MNTYTAPTPTVPAKRRTLRSPPPKPKSKFFSRPPPTPRVQVRRLGDGRHVEPEWVPIPKFTTHCPPAEYQLIPLEEAQRRDEIVHRTLLPPPTKVRVPRYVCQIHYTYVDRKFFAAL
ncbi:hypothetical protein C8Q70DRAFT_1056703 [Cubamyces menziesii]|uniref:Uncharacterized protein n=1 Tax=Trametes cubensis TaxID=1111947 RepID=A0AAD7TV62_9APHY|nr:hypothetical protein C8Q70DRAFT_1056703 [Cubamyces menziesii]KAJ8482392.1 hypothetical protein ONZ51_g5386 [Trametes cubensis]